MDRAETRLALEEAARAIRGRRGKCLIVEFGSPNQPAGSGEL
jgi:hypothetical protein